MSFKSFGQAVRAARKARGLTLEVAATNAGIDPSLLSRLENGGVGDLGLNRAVALCRTLDLSLDEVVGLRKPPKQALPRAAHGRTIRKIARLLDEAKDAIEDLKGAG